jgi:hypothetical protein
MDTKKHFHINYLAKNQNVTHTHTHTQSICYNVVTSHLQFAIDLHIWLLFTLRFRKPNSMCNLYLKSWPNKTQNFNNGMKSLLIMKKQG